MLLESHGWLQSSFDQILMVLKPTLTIGLQYILQDVLCPLLGMEKMHMFQSVQVETRLKSRDKVRLKESEVLKCF